MGGAFTDLSDRPVAWTIPADLVGGQAGDWVKVIRLDHLDEWLALDDQKRMEP